MKPTFRRPLATSIAAALALALLAPAANAQQDPTATTRTKTMREQRAERMAELGKGKEDAKQAEDKPAAYPNATRTQPDAKSSGKMIKNLQGLQELFEKQDMAGVIARAEEIVAMPSANAYDKSFAYSLAANAAADQDDQAKAAEYFRKAVDANGLDNDSHYTTMFNLAVIQFGLEKYAEALATVDRFLAESKSEKPEHQAFRAGILANLERHDEAAAIYKDLIAKNPNDKRILMNAVAALQNADKQDQANALLEDAYKRGMLTESRELRALYIGYMNASRWDDTQKVIDAGVSKGVLQPGPDLARDYQILAQNAYADDKIPLAIELYGKAAPMAADGEAYLNLAKVLEYSGKKAEAKAAAQKALDKGIKKPEEAKGILSR
ncbi:tetratricopeptide repeat protein [Thermomonas sp.]|uniref:tetratricopeptide repeat protein n=1 Tax=Thermomonas sp. TaxID=1971895 RepID=UPI0035AE443B